MVGKREMIVTLTVLDSLSKVNGSNLSDITEAFARDFEMTKTAAAPAVRTAIARGKTIGYVVESPRGKYSLQGFCNDCGECGGKSVAAKSKGKKGAKGKGKGIAKKKSSGIVKKKVKGSVKRAAKK